VIVNETGPADAFDVQPMSFDEALSQRPSLLRLRAEMRVPGRAWLQFEVDPSTAGGVLIQTAFFEPKGLPGLAYWYLLYPIHALIFRGMIRAFARRAGAR